MKRPFDFLFASLLLAIFCVPAIVIMLIVKLTSKGTIIYWSDRVGKNNLIFISSNPVRIMAAIKGGFLTIPIIRFEASYREDFQLSLLVLMDLLISEESQNHQDLEVRIKATLKQQLRRTNLLRVHLQARKRRKKKSRKKPAVPHKPLFLQHYRFYLRCFNSKDQ